MIKLTLHLQVRSALEVLLEDRGTPYILLSLPIHSLPTHLQSDLMSLPTAPLKRSETRELQQRAILSRISINNHVGYMSINIFVKKCTSL